MSVSESALNKATLLSLHDAVNSGEGEVAIWAVIDKAFHPEVRLSTPLQSDVTGREAVKGIWSMLLRVYPDIRVVAEEVIAEGDRVASRNTVTGTHRGEHLGVAPTGRSVTYGEMFMGRFDDGRIVQMWGVVDIFCQLRQLGAV